MDLAEFLAGVPELDHASRPQLHVLAACARRRRAAAREAVLREGDTSADVFMVEEGEVRVERSTPYGAHVLAVLGHGEIFGEAAFLDARARSGSVVAAAPSALVVLDALALGEACARDQRFALTLYWAFWKSLAKKLRSANDALSGFFAQEGGAAIAAAPAPAPAGEVRVGLAAKRSLFSEQQLSGLEISLLSSLSREARFAAGQTIFREGDEGDAMYVVLEGRVRISKHVPGAGEEALAFLGRGEYFGEMALIEGLPRSADARAHDQGAVVLSLPRDVVERLLDERKLGSLKLLRLLCGLVAKRLREMDDKVVTWKILAAGGSG